MRLCAPHWLLIIYLSLSGTVRPAPMSLHSEDFPLTMLETAEGIRYHTSLNYYCDVPSAPIRLLTARLLRLLQLALLLQLVPLEFLLPFL